MRATTSSTAPRARDGDRRDGEASTAPSLTDLFKRLARTHVERRRRDGAAARDDDDDDDDDALVRAMTARAWARALGAERRTLSGRAASALARRETRRRRDDDERTNDDEARAIGADEMYVRLCERDGDDGRARAMDEMLAALEASAGEDAAAIQRLAFALEGSGGGGNERASGAGGLERIDVVASAGRDWSAVPDVGRLRIAAATTREFAMEDDGAEAARRVPGLRHGAVFGLDRAVVDEGDGDDDDDDGDDDDRVVSGEIDSAKDDDAGGRDAGVADKALALDRGSGDSASLWLAAAADIETTTLRSCWDTRNAGARATSSALDAETFDLAYRRAFRPVKGIDTEPVIASERDCAHVVAMALSGCQTSADILVAAAASTGSGVRMRFASSSTLAFRNALKTMASAAERRCELDYAVSRMTTPYMRPMASAIRDILRAHAAALQAMPEATAERRLAERDTVDDLTETQSDVGDVTLLEVTVHTKRLRRQVDIIFNLITDERSLDTSLVPHPVLIRRLETSLSHVEDEETPMIQYLYARAAKPIIDDTLSWIYAAAPPFSKSEFFIECSPTWSNLSTFHESPVRGGAPPCWLGGRAHDGEDEFAETDTLTIARVRSSVNPALAVDRAKEVLRIGLQLRILQRLPHTRGFARAVKDAFVKISAFQAHTERDARQWLNRVRLLESRVVALARESTNSMHEMRAARARELDSARAAFVAKTRAEILAREKARLRRLEEIDESKRVERKGQLEELDEREKQRRDARAQKIADERAWLEDREEKQRAFEQQKVEKKMEETRLRLEQEDAKLAWFRWHESRLALNDKRRAFVRAMESVQEEEAVTALANAMSLGFATSPSPSNDLFIEPFESVTPTVMIEEAEEVNVIEEDDIASDDFADASEMFIDESATSSPSTVLSLHSADDDERSVDIKEKDIVETVSAPDNMDEMRDGAKDLETHDHTSRAYLGEAFGTPLPLLLEQEMREIITRQSDVLGRYTTTVLMDHLALELHLDAIVRFTMGGELGFADALLNNLQSKCVAARERMTQGSARVMQTVLEGAIDDTGLRDDHMSKRLRLCENADALVSVDPYNLNLSAAVECSYAAPWPLNLIFADAGDDHPLAHTKIALLQIRHAASAVKDVSALVHASSRTRALLDSTQTNLDLRARRLRKLSLLASSFQHFVDALHGHVFEAVHVGARGRLFASLRDDGGNILPRNIDALRDVFDEFCARTYAACFLRPIDTALKALVDDGLQLALELKSLLASSDAESLLEDGLACAAAQQIHSKFHALMTQLCFRARITSSDAAVGFIQRVDFNEFYLGATIDMEF
jgi:hypothetical protein|tara:strand:- start:19959 stop:23930 length:3972 start_codon:yes stop_codon:yes gene_type:complete